MKKLLLLLLATCAVAGCSHHYVMRMSNGTQITTASKPRLKNGTYYYKDATGQQQSIPQGRVREIEPASMAAKEKSPFLSTPAR